MTATTITEIVVVTTPWCHHCAAIEPLLQRLADQHAGTVRLEHVDASECPERAAALHVRGTPTLIALTDGVEQRRIVGRVPDADLAQFFASAGAHRPFPVDGVTRAMAAAGVLCLGAVTGAAALWVVGATLSGWTAATMWRWSR